MARAFCPCNDATARHYDIAPLCCQHLRPSIMSFVSTLVDACPIPCNRATQRAATPTDRLRQARASRGRMVFELESPARSPRAKRASQLPGRHTDALSWSVSAPHACVLGHARESQARARGASIT